MNLYKIKTDMRYSNNLYLLILQKGKEVNNDRLTIKSSILNDRQKAVIETIRMRLNEKQSLEYLKEVGYDDWSGYITIERKAKGGIK